MRNDFANLKRMCQANGNGKKVWKSEDAWIPIQMGFSPIRDLRSAIKEYKREFVSMMQEGKRWAGFVRTPEDCAIRISRDLTPRRLA